MGDFMSISAFNWPVSTRRLVQRILVLVSLAFCMLASACTSYSFENIKVTVTVEDNGVLYTGSSVQQLMCHGTVTLMGAWMQPGGCEPKGEAVAVKIGDKGWAFMIFSGYEGPDDTELDFKEVFYPRAIREGRPAKSKSKAWYVPLDRPPMFVRFKNLSDRRTVERVDAKRFDKHFGAGVKLVSIKCEPTFQWVTRGKVPKLLPWLDELGTSVTDLSPPGQPRSLISQISKLNFVWE
jgi:hypothetical protein